MTTLSLLKPAVAASLAHWHHMVATRDLSELPQLLREDAVFRSPVAFTAYPGAAAVALFLNAAVTVFENFAYHRRLATEDGLNVVLEFSARVGDKELKGVDLIRFDEAGKIAEFEVMVRPMKAMQALAEEMGKRVAPYLQTLKMPAAR